MPATFEEIIENATAVHDGSAATAQDFCRGVAGTARAALAAVGVFFLVCSFYNARCKTKIA